MRPYMPLVLLLLVISPLRAAELVFVRHAETQANATARYNARTINAFSALGERQIRTLTTELMRGRYDVILVSPSERALRTIAPYLRAQHRRAVIWPELYECCDAHTRMAKGGLTYGAKILLPRDLQDLFILDPGHDRLPSAPSYEAGLQQISACAARLRQAYGSSEQTVLVVGHSLMGGRLLELLQGRPMVGRIRPPNASITTIPLH